MPAAGGISSAGARPRASVRHCSTSSRSDDAGADASTSRRDSERRDEHARWSAKKRPMPVFWCGWVSTRRTGNRSIPDVFLVPDSGRMRPDRRRSVVTCTKCGRMFTPPRMTPRGGRPRTRCDSCRSLHDRIAGPMWREHHGIGRLGSTGSSPPPEAAVVAGTTVVGGGEMHRSRCSPLPECAAVAARESRTTRARFHVLRNGACYAQ